MKFTRRDVLVGLAILVVAAGLIYWFKLRPQRTSTTPLPTIKVTEQEIEDKFRLDIPDNIEKAELKDVSGGDGGGIATRNEILAELVDPKVGFFYQAWLEKDGKVISLGKLRIAKGGYLIEYDSAKYPGYDKVTVSLEKVFDSKIEIKVLEGSF